MKNRQAKKRGKIASMVALIFICIFAAGVNTWRIVRVPFLQQPDELAHYDYISAIYDANGLYRTNITRTGTHTTPQATYLERSLDYARLRYNNDNRPNSMYETTSYSSQIDQNAPKTRSDEERGKADVPYAALTYPVTYYLMAATVEEARDVLFGTHILEDAYLVRFLGLPMLVVTLLAIYGILREVQTPRAASVLLTAAAAALPSNTTIFAYIQPDALTTMLVTLATFFAIRLVNDTDRESSRIGFLIATTSVTTVKLHYGIIVFAALALAISVNEICKANPWKKMLAVGVMTQVLAIVWDRTTTLTTTTPTFQALRDDPHKGYTVASLVAESLETIYAGGNAFASFWYTGGIWLSSPFLPAYIVPFFSVLILALTLLTFTKIGLNTVRDLRSPENKNLQSKIKILFGQPLVTIYVSWTGFLILADVISHNQLGLLGRYWAPVLPSILCGLPILAFKNKKKLIVPISTGWFILAIILCSLDLNRTQAAYANPVPVASKHVNRFLVINDIDVYHEGESYHTSGFDVNATQQDKIEIRGWGLDDESGSASQGAYIAIDNKNYSLPYHLPTNEYTRARLSDDDLSNITFDGYVSMHNISKGHHIMKLYLQNLRGTKSYWAGTVNLNVE